MLHLVGSRVRAVSPSECADNQIAGIFASRDFILKNAAPEIGLYGHNGAVLPDNFDPREAAARFRISFNAKAMLFAVTGTGGPDLEDSASDLDRLRRVFTAQPWSPAARLAVLGTKVQ